MYIKQVILTELVVGWFPVRAAHESLLAGVDLQISPAGQMHSVCDLPSISASCKPVSPEEALIKVIFFNSISIPEDTF